MRIVISLILSTILVCLILSCATKQEVTSFWRASEARHDQPYESFFILVMSGERAARATLESDLAGIASEHGFKALRSVDYFPTAFTDRMAPSKEDVIAKVRELGCDAIFTLSLLDVRSDHRWIEGHTTYETRYVPRFDYYGNFLDYYWITYPVVSTPGYYATDETYFIEANLYDTETGRIQWSMQSRAYNPSNMKSFSKKYTKLLIDRLEQEHKAVGAE